MMSVIEKNPVTVPDRPDPFKQMAAEDDRDMDTRMKMALVKDSLRMLQADFGHDKENRGLGQQIRNSVKPGSKLKKEDSTAKNEFDTITFTNRSDTEPPEESVDYRDHEMPSLALETSHEIHISSENIANCSGDFSIDNGDVRQKDISQNNNDNLSTDSTFESPALQTGMDSFKDFPQLLPRSDLLESHEIKDKRDRNFIDQESQSVPSLIAHSDLEDSHPQLSDKSPKDSTEPDNRSETAVEEAFSPTKDVICEKSQLSSEISEATSNSSKVETGKCLLSQRLSSKSSERLSRKIAQMELSDSDSDWNIGELESPEKGTVRLGKLSQASVTGTVNANKSRDDCSEESDEFVFKKPMSSISAGIKHKSHSSIIKKSGICVDSERNDVNFDCIAGKAASSSSSDENNRKGESVDAYGFDDLPDILPKKKIVLKRKKQKSKKIEGDTPTSIDMEPDGDDNDLPTIVPAKSKLRRLGPRIKFQKSKRPPQSLFLPGEPQFPTTNDLAAASSSSKSVESAGSKSDGQSDNTSVDPYVIEDDTEEADRLLLEISNVR